MPNQERTPRRTLRIEGELWAAAQAEAADRGESVSDVVRRALLRYARHRLPASPKNLGRKA